MEAPNERWLESELAQLSGHWGIKVVVAETQPKEVCRNTGNDSAIRPVYRPYGPASPP
jgi:hypothetical protein